MEMMNSSAYVIKALCIKYCDEHNPEAKEMLDCIVNSCLSDTARANLAASKRPSPKG